MSSAQWGPYCFGLNMFTVHMSSPWIKKKYSSFPSATGQIENWVLDRKSKNRWMWPRDQHWNNKKTPISCLKGRATYMAPLLSVRQIIQGIHRNYCNTPTLRWQFLKSVGIDGFVCAVEKRLSFCYNLVQQKYNKSISLEWNISYSPTNKSQPWNRHKILLTSFRKTEYSVAP